MFFLNAGIISISLAGSISLAQGRMLSAASIQELDDTDVVSRDLFLDF